MRFRYLSFAPRWLPGFFRFSRGSDFMWVPAFDSYANTSYWQRSISWGWWTLMFIV